MRLCKVTGTVVSTRKHERLRPAKLLTVRPIGVDGAVLEGAVEEIALDPRFDAGVGDVVLTAKQGTVVAQIMDANVPEGGSGTPANVIIIAVVEGRSGEGMGGIV